MMKPVNNQVWDQVRRLQVGRQIRSQVMRQVWDQVEEDL